MRFCDQSTRLLSCFVVPASSAVYQRYKKIRELKVNMPGLAGCVSPRHCMYFPFEKQAIARNLCMHASEREEHCKQIIRR